MFYAAMAVGALVATWWNIIEFFASDNNGGLVGYVEDGFANPAAASLALDVVFVGVVAQVFMLVEGRRVGVPYPWLVALVMAGALVAIAVALPSFLIVRQLTLARPAVAVHRSMART